MRIRLGELLVQHGILTDEQVKSALEYQRRDPQKRKLGECILALRLTTEDAILGVLSRALSIPVVDLRFETPTKEALGLVSFTEADRSLILPLRVEVQNKRRSLILVMADPTNLETIDMLQFRLGMTVKPVLATANQVRKSLVENYRDRQAVELDAHPTVTAPGAGMTQQGNSDATWVGSAARPTDAAELKLTGGPGIGRVVRLGLGKTLVFGRSPDVDIVVSDMRLSRRHFAVAHSGTAVEVIDLDSSNGTSLNGSPVKRAPLKTGDVIEAGTTALTVRLLGR